MVTAGVAGYLVWKVWRKPVPSFLAGFLGGVFIDLDHLLDYFLAFGFSFNLSYFLQGYEFLKSDKIYVIFHGWEYLVVLVVLVLLIKSNLWLKSAILALFLGSFFHLLVDVTINHGMTFKSYSLSYRMLNNFDLQKIVTTEHYKRHLLQKEAVTLLEGDF